jgi:hypothetical protein
MVLSKEILISLLFLIPQISFFIIECHYVGRHKTCPYTLNTTPFTIITITSMVGI